MSKMQLDNLADRFVRAMTPDDDVRTAHQIKQVIRADGSVDPARVPVAFPWQSRDFQLPGVVVLGANRGGILQFPQGGIVRRLAARCRTAPTGAAAEFTVTVNGANASPPLKVAIPAGQTMADVVASHSLPPMSNLALIVSAGNGAADVTVTVHVEPVLTVQEVES